MPQLPLADPLQWFRIWMDDARASSKDDPTAMSLATVDADGQPTTRIVLLKAFDRKGFVFYTNLKSAKARHLQSQPKAGLCFLWYSLGRQVRIDGTARLVDDEEADAYFATRARGSQIGAWASKQSAPMDDRHSLERRVKKIEARFEGRPVERPPFWSGYRVVPATIEFWQMRPDRLHDRWRFERIGDDWQWQRQRLYP